jgi:hypothetical protein
MSLSPYLSNSMHQLPPGQLLGFSLTKEMCDVVQIVHGLWETSEIIGEQNIANRLRQLRNIMAQSITIQVILT